MKKRFVAKKRIKLGLIKLVLWLLVLLISFYWALNLLINNYINSILSDDKTDYLIALGLNKNNTYFSGINPEKILSLGMNYIFDKKEEKPSIPFIIDDGTNASEPLIYIYNTHDTESYTSHLLDAYNISYTVKTASLIMRDYLSDYGLPVYVETESMGTYLNNNNLLYKDSYLASKYYLLKRKEEYKSLKYFIDIHRDSATYNTTTTNIDGKNYAKVLFVIGLDYPGYENNLALAESLNSKLDSRISRGISKKTGSKVNGIYNQDLSNNCILIEIGGVDNTIEEINNTVKLLSIALFEYISEV